jgi:hypothetical protein
MTHPFDPGYGAEPFRTLCEEYPGPDVYPPADFRVEWGPIFHRGRLDGSARILVIGQDPAQHETVVRRILVGEAGERIQGFLAKLGIDKSYVMVNTFVYSVYGIIKAKYRKDPGILQYRHRWLDALVVGQHLEAVVALGVNADAAWTAWKATTQGQTVNLAYAKLTHPTQPESSSKGDKTKLAAATKLLLEGWNSALQHLKPAIVNPDTTRPLVLYGEAFQPGDRARIPAIDLPAGLPAWIRERDNWARRVGAEVKKKRGNITITVPKDLLP